MKKQLDITLKTVSRGGKAGRVLQTTSRKSTGAESNASIRGRFNSVISHTRLSMTYPNHRPGRVLIRLTLRFARLHNPKHTYTPLNTFGSLVYQRPKRYPRISTAPLILHIASINSIYHKREEKCVSLAKPTS